MTGQIYINDKDAWETWGVFMVGESLDNLLLPPPMKSYTENNFRSQHGKQIFFGNPRKESRDIDIEFCISAENRAAYLLAYKSFTNELSSSVVSLRLPELNIELSLILSSFLSLGYYDKFGKLTVRFNDPLSEPTIYFDEVALVSDDDVFIISETGKKITF